MHSILSAVPSSYSFLYLCKFTGSDQELVELASFISSIDSKDNLFGFDRSLWSGLSSGQMPSQLYTFNFYGSDKGCEVEERIMVLFSKDSLENIPTYLDVVHELVLGDEEINDGEMAESFEEDEEFTNCLYASCLVWKPFSGERPLIDQVRNIWSKAEELEVQLLYGTSLFKQDDWVDAYFKGDAFNSANKLLAAVHLLIPGPEKLQELEEAVQDKERIHLDPEIKGIYC